MQGQAPSCLRIGRMLQDSTQAGAHEARDIGSFRVVAGTGCIES